MIISKLSYGIYNKNNPTTNWRNGIVIDSFNENQWQKQNGKFTHYKQIRPHTKYKKYDKTGPLEENHTSNGWAIEKCNMSNAPN